MNTEKLGAHAGQAMLTAALLGLPAQAAAFTEPRTYAEAPENGGGGGRFFTSSPAEGYGCGVCHSGEPAEPLVLRGVPEEGYEPGESYALRVTWPEFAVRARELRATEGEPPAVGLVLELIAETGEGAGSLELASAAQATGGELCVLPEGRHGALLYAVRPGAPIREQERLCEAESLGERCLATVLSCGASELRVRWTAPMKRQGVIWLSAGFVATDRVSGDPFEDAVTELAQPILPAGSERDHPVSELSASCSSAGARPAAAPDWLVMLWLAWAWRWARRPGRKAVLFASALGLLAACRSDIEPVGPGAAAARYPRAGLFTPGSAIGAKPYDAGSLGDAGLASGGLSAEELREIEDSISQGDSQERCMPFEGVAGTPGVLEVTFSTASYGGHYEPENCGAVWIEDGAGQYVATPLIWAKLRVRNLFIWDARRCKQDGPDVVSSATLPDHTELHAASWDGTDFAGNVVPDGSYVLNIEVTEDEFNYGRRSEYAFEKGPTPLVLEPAGEESVKNLKLTFTPAL